MVRKVPCQGLGKPEFAFIRAQWRVLWCPERTGDSLAIRGTFRRVKKRERELKVVHIKEDTSYILLAFLSIMITSRKAFPKLPTSQPR